MELPASIPDNERNNQAIEALLNRVRGLDKEARSRLSSMLDDEVDLPYLDNMEREYAKAFRNIAPEHANVLRGRFVRALNEQRAFLIGMVRNALTEAELRDAQLHSKVIAE
ncbi:MAG TPA: hypothetical protein PLS90_06530 [Candidatus Sumerlaeota bacterium]|nr:hypothetical protein [Candidatus Sumerlaeota bacterium]HOR28917.1 hypothetical protein [Candidatus Sumerlaeota bacterium]HPK02096.1 hypothetical protein [Candidatus Sumerlaeota bacterium]